MIKSDTFRSYLHNNYFTHKKNYPMSLDYVKMDNLGKGANCYMDPKQESVTLSTVLCGP